MEDINSVIVRHSLHLIIQDLIRSLKSLNKLPFIQIGPRYIVATTRPMSNESTNNKSHRRNI